jgi:hypothetical protein
MFSDLDRLSPWLLQNLIELGFAAIYPEVAFF